MTPTNTVPGNAAALRIALGPGFALAGPSDYVLRTITAAPQTNPGVGARPHS